MDIGQRLKNLEERRGESNEATLDRVAAQIKADPETPAEIAKLLESDNPDDRMMALIGGIEGFKALLQTRHEITLPGIALEDGFTQNLATILDKLIAWFVKMYYKFTEYMGATKIMLDEVTDRLEDVTNMSRLHRRSHTTSTIVISTRLNYYVCNGRYVTNIGQLSTVLERTRNVIVAYFKMASHNYPVGAAEIRDAVRNGEPLTKIAEIAQARSPLSLFGSRLYEAEGGVLRSHDMLGNLCSVLSVDQGDNAFETIRSISFALEESREGRLDQPEALEFTRFSISTTDELLRYLSEIAKATEDAIGGFFSNGRHYQMQQLRDAMEDIRKILGNPQAMKYEEAEYRQMVSVIETYLAWMSSPFLEMSSHSIRVMKAMLNLIEANLT